MNQTGIVRRLDDLGRVVVPKEIRKSMGLKEGDPIEFFTTDENGTVIIRKYVDEFEPDYKKMWNELKRRFPEYRKDMDEIEELNRP